MISVPPQADKLLFIVLQPLPDNLVFFKKFVVGHLELVVLGLKRIRDRAQLSASLPSVLVRSKPGATVTYSLSRGLVNGSGRQGKVEIRFEQNIPSKTLVTK